MCRGGVLARCYCLGMFTTLLNCNAIVTVYFQPNKLVMYHGLQQQQVFKFLKIYTSS